MRPEVKISLNTYDRRVLGTARALLRSALRSVDRVLDESSPRRDLSLMNIGACAETVAELVMRTQNRQENRA